jgi:hypothetical protein
MVAVMLQQVSSAPRLPAYQLRRQQNTAAPTAVIEKVQAGF